MGKNTILGTGAGPAPGGPRGLHAPTPTAPSPQVAELPDLKDRLVAIGIEIQCDTTMFSLGSWREPAVLLDERGTKPAAQSNCIAKGLAAAVACFREEVFNCTRERIIEFVAFHV